METAEEWRRDDEERGSVGIGVWYWVLGIGYPIPDGIWGAGVEEGLETLRAFPSTRHPLFTTRNLQHSTDNTQHSTHNTQS